jgi:uncharacterized protein
VTFRDQNGPFRDRRHILKVPRVGERTFQQAAGFLRIMDGTNPLDASAVHPKPTRSWNASLRNRRRVS